MLHITFGYQGIDGNMLYLAASNIWAFMVIMAAVCIVCYMPIMGIKYTMVAL